MVVVVEQLAGLAAVPRCVSPESLSSMNALDWAGAEMGFVPGRQIRRLVTVKIRNRNAADFNLSVTSFWSVLSLLMSVCVCVCVGGGGAIERVCI